MTFREALLRRGVPFRVGARNELSMCCLFCADKGETPDHRFRLSVNLVSGKAHCFNCNWKSLHAFAAIIRKLQIDVAIDGEEPEQDKPDAPRLPDDFQVLDRAYSDLDKTAIEYIQNRGVTRDQILRKQIGLSLMGRYAYRVIFPVVYRKHLVGIVGRDFTGYQEPRYLNSRGEKGLYNYGRSTRIILCEGVFKALRIERVVPDFRPMAVLGRSLTDFQLREIEESGCHEVVVWPDPDKPGREGAVAMLKQLAVLHRVAVGAVWPVYAPADVQDFDGMAETWNTSVEGYSWGLLQRMEQNARGRDDEAEDQRKSQAYGGAGAFCPA